ncbi:hypothetical protein [Bacillus wiedmannii]|uniref:hypothetical protein n=1 Tax=Bacillus wiedmannii TaxID=1890302 RepID=UPI000BF60F9F|nr:hypothetical protein [Bacillus wiedmannii]PGD64133.1 hypothetical protein COM41_12045 [Bacillus wiedmannii]
MKRRHQKKLGYYMKGLMFPCIRELRPLLGAQDAAIQTNEIILRNFEEIGMNHAEGINKYLKTLADKYKISHGANNFQYVKLKIAEANIINTFNIIDFFFKRFSKQIQLYKNISKNEWIDKDKDNEQLDSLNQVVVNLKKEEITKLKKIPEYHLLDHYRLIRNSIVHISEKNSNKLAKLHTNLIDRYGEHFSEHYGTLPNLKDQLTYEDYFLYTRAVKYFSNILNDAANLQYADIVNIALNDTDFLAKLRRVERVKEKGIRARRIAYIKGYFRQKHEYGNSKQQQNHFLEAFKDFDSIKWN